MSPEVEQPVSPDVRSAHAVQDTPASVSGPRGEPTPDLAGHHHPHRTHGDHHVLRDSPQDRWRWRAKVRQNSHQLRVYRVVVAFVGTLFIALGFVTGPLPGPGGIPLVLLGLAIWASEFVWAQHLMDFFKAQLHRFRSWSWPRQVLAFVLFFLACGLFGYGYLLVLGPPGWTPTVVVDLVTRLPGV